MSERTALLRHSSHIDNTIYGSAAMLDTKCRTLLVSKSVVINQAWSTSRAARRVHS